VRAFAPSPDHFASCLPHPWPATVNRPNSTGIRKRGETTHA
jgi:hypothetical protein